MWRRGANCHPGRTKPGRRALREGGGIRGVRVDVAHCWQAQLLPGVVFGPLHEMHTGSVCMVQNEVAAALVGIDPRPEAVQASVQGHPARTLLSRPQARR